MRRKVQHGGEVRAVSGVCSSMPDPDVDLLLKYFSSPILLRRSEGWLGIVGLAQQRVHGPASP